MTVDAEEELDAILEDQQYRLQWVEQQKLEDDPRIIGSEKKDKYGRPKGIGNFIRNTSLDEFPQIIDYIQSHMSPTAQFRSFDTICRQVANRMPNIASFAVKHDLVLFVSGRKSSNGKVLFNECKSINANCHQIERANEIDMKWLNEVESVGICGATSTPKWLMEECRDWIMARMSGV